MYAIKLAEFIANEASSSSGALRDCVSWKDTQSLSAEIDFHSDIGTYFLVEIGMKQMTS